MRHIFEIVVIFLVGIGIMVVRCAVVSVCVDAFGFGRYGAFVWK